MKKIIFLFLLCVCIGVLCSCKAVWNDGNISEKTVLETVITDIPESDINANADVEYYSFYSDSCGYKIVGYDQAAGKEYHYLYQTHDGGSTWNRVETDIDIIWPHMVRGIGFLNENVGFVSFRYDYDEFNPSILKTTDGGVTWSKQMNICDLLSGYTSQGFMLEPSAPIFEENSTCSIEITAIRHNDVDDDIVDITINSVDYENWTLSD